MQALWVGFAVTSVSFAGSGVALLLRRRAVLSGTLLVLGGAVGVAASLASERLVGSLAALSAGLLLPAALVCFPSLNWRRPVDSLVLTAVAGSGLVAVLWSSDEARATMGFAVGCVLLAFSWYRLEVSREMERRAVAWMVLAACATGLVYGLLSFSSENSAIPGLGLMVFALVGPAMYVGATLPELIDVRGLVVTAVVLFVAVITVLSLYVLATILLDASGSGDLSVGAQGLVAAIVAASFRPIQVLLRGVIDELLFGERPDPLGAASAMAGQIGSDPAVALRAIREALVIPYAAVLVEGEPLASSGTETTHTRTLDLDGAGELVVGLRPGDLSFSSGDEQVLRLTVPLLAQTLRARALAAEVVESRGRTIAAVEEERRRLRRDLHDGLGPRLSGVAFTADAARNLVRSDPETAAEMLAQLRADTTIAIEEIRAMVYAMRPPALDELGLVPALRQQAVGLRNKDGRPIAVSVAADELPDLSAAVEVAAYRIVTEALANVARHSTSPTAAVRIDTTDDGLRLEVTDAGSSGVWRPGVGMASMRERATELGGTLDAGPGPSGGKVAALLPL